MRHTLRAIHNALRKGDLRSSRRHISEKSGTLRRRSRTRSGGRRSSSRGSAGRVRSSGRLAGGGSLGASGGLCGCGRRAAGSSSSTLARHCDRFGSCVGGDEEWVLLVRMRLMLTSGVRGEKVLMLEMEDEDVELRMR